MPIQMYDSQDASLYEEIIPANSSKLIKLPVNTQDGIVLVDNQTILQLSLLRLSNKSCA